MSDYEAYLSWADSELFDIAGALSEGAVEAIIAFGTRVLTSDRPDLARLHAPAATRGAMFRRHLITSSRPLPGLTLLGWRMFHYLIECDSPHFAASADPWYGLDRSGFVAVAP